MQTMFRWAKVQKLQAHGFACEKVDDFAPEKIDNLVKKDKKGYILEKDVDYPKELHEVHNKFPFLEERMKIRKVKKILPNLKDKKIYVVHIKNLNQALKNGLKLKKLYRVIRFEQSYRMMPYVMLNTRLKAVESTSLRKIFLSL